MQQEGTTRLGPVFYVSVFIALLFIVWGVFFSSSLEAFNAAALGIITESFGWVYLIATTMFIVFLFFLAFSRFGKIRLGKDGDRPEFSTGAWLAMLFSAGMGIGLVFYGVAEPMSHLSSPPPFIGVESGTVEAAEVSMQYTFFHWGLHAWAIYGLVALSLAYFQFRKGSRGLISSAFYPLAGRHHNGCAVYDTADRYGRLALQSRLGRDDAGTRTEARRPDRAGTATRPTRKPPEIPPSKRGVS